MTDKRLTSPAAQKARRRQAHLEELRDQAPAFLDVHGMHVELARCTTAMRDALLAYTSPNIAGAQNPLADLEAIEAEHIDRAVIELAIRLVASGKSDEAVEDALVSVRGHLEDHFLQRKYARLYGQ
ncbi:hypothetical protein [Chromohalobacter israelensis]|uniref:hypothetical protein n=1 Tax=Chromohalobacter israelensis TaxID=141390 RepID=UPI0005576BD7|nr:hypothetical protein [Chromohalobacter israelensis]MDF9433003.1 hypothetical protein [Chromohalobacter israelensis]